eukprot:scaffold6430_cov135-Skeletonema_dohrnii-CCMP3373.AAC.6
MDASAFFSSGPSPPQQDGHAPQQSAQFYGGSGGYGGGGTMIGRANSMESDSEFETLDINEPPTHHHHHGATAVPGSTAATNSGNNNNNNNGAAANFFGGQQHPPQQQYGNQYQASSGPENFSMASSGPENFSMPSEVNGGNVSAYTNSNHQNYNNNASNNYSASSNYNNNNYNNQEAPMEYEGVALQTALNTFTAVGRLGGGLASNVIGGSSRLIGGVSVAGGVGSVVGGASKVVGGAKNVVGASGMGTSVTSGMGTMMKGIGNFASGLVGVGEEDNEIAAAMAQWAEGQKRLHQQQGHGNGNGSGQQGNGGQGQGNVQGNVGQGQQQQQQQQHVQEGYLHQEHRHQPPPQQQQYAQPQQQQGYSQTNNNTAQQVFNAPSPLSTPQFGATRNTTTTAATVGPPEMSLGVPATAAIVPPPSHHVTQVQNYMMDDSATNAPPGQYTAVSSNMVSSEMSRMASDASAADVFGGSTSSSVAVPVSRMTSDASAADVFGSTTTTAAAASENGNSSAENVFEGTTTAATNVFGGGATSTTQNTSAADVFGGTTTAASGNASSVENVFGATSIDVNPANEVFGATNMASAADVFGTSASNAASASKVFGATEATTTAADVFGGATYPPTTAEEVLGGNEATEIPTAAESIEVPPATSTTNAVAKPPVTGNVLAMETGNYHPPTAMVTMMGQQQDLNIYAPVDVPSVSENIVDRTISTTNAVAKPPATGNVLAMEIGNYHPPTAMVTMMEQQQDMNVSAPVDVPSVSEHVVDPNVAVKEEVKEVVEMFEGTSIQQETPPVAASSNTSTIASSPAESTEKHTITSSLALPEKRPTVVTSNTHRRFQLNLPKKASLPLPPPRNKKASSSVSGGGSLGSTSRKKKLSSSPFRKPPPMEVSATPRFHVPPPAGGSSVGSGGSGSHHHYPLPKAATPGSTSVLTASPLPTPRVLDDGESPLLPAASTSAVVEPKVVDTTESEPDVPKNASPDAPAADDGDKVPTEEPKVAEASIGTESTPPVVFQPLELDQIVEAVATPSEEFKMELPKKEVNYNAGEDIVNNVASTMTQGVMHDAVLHVASSAVNREVPPPTYSLTTRPIYHKDELPKAESSLFTEDGASDYQSTLRDDDLPPMSDNNEDDDEVLLSVESEVAPTQDESEKLDAASDTPKEEEFREVSGNAMVSSSVATEYPMSDYQEQVTDEDFVVVDSSDVDNNVVPVSSSPWVETMDPASGQTYYYNQENGETSWQLPIESVENVPVAAANEETVDNEETGESTWDKPSIKEAPDASPEDEVPADDIGAAEAEEVENNANNQQQIDGVFEEPASMADDANESPSPEVSPMADHVVEESVPADDANNEHKVVVEPEITEDEAPLLPDGWVKGIDEASGNPYYYNSVTGESSWDLPSASTEQGNVAVESAPVVTLSNAEEEINVTDTSNEHPKVEVEHEEVAQVNVNEAAQVHNDSPAEGQVEEESLQESEVSYVGPLPAGWIEANDPSGRVFYFNSSTGQSSWERPKSVTPEKVEVVDTSVKTEDDAQIQIENLVLAEESVAPLEDDEDNLSFESLPPGWIETKDPASGQIYFYNEKTDESSWSRPIDPAVNVASEVESEVKDESDIALPETVEEPVPSEASIIDEANIALADQKPVEEPRVNSEAVHEGSTYDSWSRPIMEVVDAQDEIAFPVDSARVPEESTPEENDADLDLQESHANEFVEESTTAEEIVPLSEEELPAGWLSSIDETTSKIFYYNEETGESTWDKPSIKEAPDASPEDEVPADDIGAAEAEEVENNANNQQQIDGVFEEPASMTDDANESPSPEVSPMADHVTEESVPADDAHESLIVEPEITEDEAPLLPDGWVKGIDEASGNPYYYNSVTGESSWDLPSASTEQGNVAVESAAVDVDNLSNGEDEVSADDIAAAETEEVENNANNQQQIDGVLEEPTPVEETVRPSSDELPPGWSSSVDEASGNIFYYNDEGITSWDKPSIEGSRDEAKPEDGTSVDKITEHQEEVEDLPDGSGEPQGGETDVGLCVSVDEWSVPAEVAGTSEMENDTIIHDEVVEEHADVEVTETVPPSLDITPCDDELPPGWFASVDESSGKQFYYNEDGRSSWEKPKVDVDDAASKDEGSIEQIDANKAEIAELDGDVCETNEMDRQEPEAVEPSTAEETVPFSEELPSGWSSSIDEATGKTFYYNEETGESTWDKPSIKEAPDASPEDEVSADDDSVDDDAAVTETVEVEHDAKTVVEPFPEVSPMADHVVEESVPADDANEHEVVVAPEITEDEVPLLPDGWVKGIDEASGNPYYYNSVTGESSWDLPSDGTSKAVASMEQGNVAVESAAVDVDNISNGEDEVPADDIAAAESEEVENNANNQQQIDGVLEEPTPVEETVRPSSDESEKLPPGWSSSVDEASGNIFYYNDEGITSWDKPSIEGSRDEAKPEDGTSVDKITEHQEEVEDLPDGSGEPEPQTGGLPHGWKELQDEATGNTYYWNEQTNETSWDYPHATADEDADAADVLTETEEKGMSEEVAEDEHISEQVASDQDVPEGWVATVDETSGNTYYYNEKTNETSWDRPVAETKPDLPFATPKLAQRCRPAHAIATFGFGGRLCVMMPQVAASLSSTVSQPSSSDHHTMRRGPVVIHRVKDLIPRGHKFSIPSSSDSDTVGPLVKAKEKDVVSFLRQRSASPENLIWNLINIAAQNKGRLKNGDDVVDGGPEEAIVDLLLSVETSKKSSHSNAPSVQSTNSDLNDVQDLLLRGDRDRAVVEALREKNYALALIIATMCDEDTYQMVARKFADDVLSAGSPLYTTALLLTDNLPLPPGHVLRDNPRHGLSFWFEDPYQDLDTNWTQQLATILSNKRGNYTKIIMTLGDRLMQLGHCHAAHVCYLATSLSLNNPSKPSTRMVLLGCDHTVPLNRVLMTPEAVEAFERSEAFEWARRLGNKRTSFSALQPFKLRYAELLADVGHEVLAREYLLSIRSCTGIGIITRSKGNPASSYDSGFVQSLRELDDRICGSTGAERSSWNANEESSKGSLFSLGRLSALVRGKESKEEEVLTPRPESEVDPLLELDTTAPPATQSRKEEIVPPAVTKPKEEPTKPPEETGALNTSIGISNDVKQASTIDDAPASAPPSLAIGESMIDQAEDSKRNEEKLSEKLSTPSEPIKKDAKKKAPASEPPVSAGLLARLFGRDKNVKVADQGEEMQAYYDDVSTKVCSSSVIFWPFNIISYLNLFFPFAEIEALDLPR